MKWKIDNEIEGIEFNGMPYKNSGVYHETFGWIKRNQITAYSDASFLPKELADKSKSRGGDVHMCKEMLLLVICQILGPIIQRFFWNVVDVLEQPEPAHQVRLTKE